MTTNTTGTAGVAIRTRGLTRHFTVHKQTVEAVRGLDLDIEQGELVAFLGPNGAGKSTTLRMLTTLIPPTSGTAAVAGHDVVREQRAVRRSIGYVGQGNGAGQQQRGVDELVSQGRAHGMSRVAARERADELVAELQLGEVAGRVVSTLSGGQRRRLDIALGLVHSPGILFLDEPSTGLDPQNRVNLQEQIRRLHAQNGTTIVLTTHYLEEADALAQRVIVIDHGQVIADDTSARLKSSLGDLLALDVPVDRVGEAGARASRLPDSAVTVEGGTLSVRVPGGRDLAAGLVVDLTAAGIAVTGLRVAGPTLDDVFLHLTGRSLREAGQGDVPVSASTTTALEGAAA